MSSAKLFMELDLPSPTLAVPTHQCRDFDFHLPSFTYACLLTTDIKNEVATSWKNTPGVAVARAVASMSTCNGYTEASAMYGRISKAAVELTLSLTKLPTATSKSWAAVAGVVPDPSAVTNNGNPAKNPRQSPQDS